MAVGLLVGGPEFEFERSFEYLHRLSLAGFYQDHPISDINPTKPDTWHCASLGITKYSRKNQRLFKGASKFSKVTPAICFVFLCVPKKADTYHVADKVFTYNLK